MKLRNKIVALALTVVSAFGLAVANKNVTKVEAAETTYSYEFTAKTFSANGTVALGDINWTLAGDGGYWGNDSTKGQQFGSGSKPYKTLTLTSDTLSNVTSITLNTSGASSIAATLQVKVGNTNVGDAITLTKTATEYTVSVEEGSLTGPVVLSYTQTSSKAIYIKSISVTYDPAVEVNPADEIQYLETMAQFGVNYRVDETLSEDQIDVYELVTDATTLAAGDQVLVVAKADSYVLGSTQNTNNRSQALVSINNNQITSIDDTVQVITLESTGTDGTFAFNVGNGYLYAANSSSNYLKTQETNDENGYWAISIDSETGVASVVAQGTNTRNNLFYNKQSGLFSCYASTSGMEDKEILIYKLYQKQGVVQTYSFANAKLRFVGTIKAELAEYVDTTAAAGFVLTLADGKTQTVNATIVEEVDGSLRFAVVLEVPEAEYDTLVTGTAFVTVNGEVVELVEKTYSVNSIVEYYLTHSADLALSNEEILVLNAFQAA